jgi:hypothetical protein
MYCIATLKLSRVDYLHIFSLNCFFISTLTLRNSLIEPFLCVGMILVHITTMTLNKNELILIYNSENIKEREALAYAKSLKNYHLREIDLTHDGISPSQLRFVQQHLDIPVADLIKEPLNEENTEDWRNMNMNDLLEWLSKKIEMIHTPIALWEDEGKILIDKYSLVSEGMELNKKRADHYENA